MKNKGFTKFIVALLALPFLFGCSSFFKSSGSSYGNGIESITHTTVPEGVEITITYTDDSKEPVTFIVPQGTAGLDGNSIREIVPGYDNNGNLTITIIYTDPAMPALTLPIPSNKGIKSINQQLDVDGNTVLTLIYTDDTMSDPIVIFKGASGISVIDIVPTQKPDGSVELEVKMSDGSKYTVLIPAPNTGNGISYMETSMTDAEYIITVVYTNGDTEELRFDKPTRWFQVYAQPGPGDYNNGDYAFDVLSHIIYTKQNGVWVVVADLNTGTSNVTYSVVFDVNGTDVSVTRGELAYTVPNGKTFYSEGNVVPELTRPNFDFLGWSTVKQPTVVNGWFTDLTPVVSDMTLYAIWKAQ